jgi:hypothetical protein
MSSWIEFQPQSIKENKKIYMILRIHFAIFAVKSNFINEKQNRFFQAAPGKSGLICFARQELA